MMVRLYRPLMDIRDWPGHLFTRHYELAKELEEQRTRKLGFWFTLDTIVTLIQARNGIRPARDTVQSILMSLVAADCIEMTSVECSDGEFPPDA